METEFRNATGKSAGEVMRDIAEFLAYPCVVYSGERQMDLRQMLPELNMFGQFSFALLSEAFQQGWQPEVAESFYRRACGESVGEELADSVIAAFRDREGESYRDLVKKYGCRFSLFDGSYWSTVLALAIDAGQVSDVMHYLRLFTVCLMEVAYMDDRNPPSTYTWNYYESFRAMLDSLTAEPEPVLLPLRVRAMGGTAGKYKNGSYYLSLGLDIENPNNDRLMRDVSVDVTLKDKDGNVITVIGDKLNCIDPGAVYHYGITKKIRGAAVAGFSAVAKAERSSKLITPVMKHIALSGLRLSKTETGTALTGTMTGTYDVPVCPVVLHYQYLSAENKILGGGGEWFFEGLDANARKDFRIVNPVAVKGAGKVVYSIDFNVDQLIR